MAVHIFDAVTPVEGKGDCRDQAILAEALFCGRIFQPGIFYII
jgi:hypothetical protein